MLSLQILSKRLIIGWASRATMADSSSLTPTIRTLICNQQLCFFAAPTLFYPFFFSFFGKKGVTTLINISVRSWTTVPTRPLVLTILIPSCVFFFLDKNSEVSFQVVFENVLSFLFICWHGSGWDRRSSRLFQTNRELENCYVSNDDDLQSYVLDGAMLVAYRDWLSSRKSVRAYVWTSVYPYYQRWLILSDLVALPTRAHELV